MIASRVRPRLPPSLASEVPTLRIDGMDDLQAKIDHMVRTLLARRGITDPTKQPLVGKYLEEACRKLIESGRPVSDILKMPLDLPPTEDQGPRP